MIKPRSLPSHFELQAEAQPWNFEGKANSHSYGIHPIQEVIVMEYSGCLVCAGFAVKVIRTISV